MSEDTIAGNKNLAWLTKQAYTAWLMRGDTLMKYEEFEAAVRAYHYAIDLCPDSAPAWCGRGVALHTLGHYYEAANSFDRAVILEPGEESYQRYAEESKRMLGELRETIASSLEPDSDPEVAANREAFHEELLKSGLLSRITKPASIQRPADV